MMTSPNYPATPFDFNQMDQPHSYDMFHFDTTTNNYEQNLDLVQQNKVHNSNRLMLNPQQFQQAPPDLHHDFTISEFNLLFEELFAQPSSPSSSIQSTTSTISQGPYPCDVDIKTEEKNNLTSSPTHGFGSQMNKCLDPHCHTCIKYKGFCKNHGNIRLCIVEGCQKRSQGRNLCIVHGGGKRCNIDGCTKACQSKGLCKAHGGGVRCTFEGCRRSSQGNGLCRSHGGGKRCQILNCDKGAQKGDLCAKHGGVSICLYSDCKTPARGGGHCFKHRKAIICQKSGCHKLRKYNGLCSTHNREAIDFQSVKEDLN